MKVEKQFTRDDMRRALSAAIYALDGSDHIVEGYSAEFWHGSYKLLRDAVEANLAGFLHDDDVAEEAIYIAAIEAAGKRLAEFSAPEGRPEPSQLAERLKQVVPGNTLVRCPRCRSFGEASGTLKFTCNKCSYYPITVAAHEVSYTKKGQSSDQQPMVLATGASSTRISEEQATAAPVTPEPPECGRAGCVKPQGHRGECFSPGDQGRPLPASEARPTTEDSDAVVMARIALLDYHRERKLLFPGMDERNRELHRLLDAYAVAIRSESAPSAPEGRTLKGDSEVAYRALSHWIAVKIGELRKGDTRAMEADLAEVIPLLDNLRALVAVSHG